MTEQIPFERKVLSENDRLAAELRRRFAEHGILVLNMVSSPGSGKTTLLEHTLRDLKHEIRMALVAGDVQTENDANRLIAAGGRYVRPIVTRGACHLDAAMVARALEALPLQNIQLLIIENVGNLVCPSSYDLGEHHKVVMVSVTEGDDKPSKYPGMFRRSSLMIINKTDLLSFCDFDVESAKDYARVINGQLEILEMSCRTRQGLDAWYDWLRRGVLSMRT